MNTDRGALRSDGGTDISDGRPTDRTGVSDDSPIARTDGGTADRRSRLLPGLAAIALFAVLVAAVLASSIEALGGPMAFPAGESVVKNIGFALFDIELGEIASEGFLAAFLILAILLDVAIDAAIFLAKREEEGVIVTAMGELRSTLDETGLGTDGGNN